MLRQFDLEDLKQVQTIAESSLKEKYSLDVYMFIHQAQNCDFLVYIRNGLVIGFICGLVKSPEGGRILMLAVHPDFRRQGIGSILLDKFIISCKKHGTKKVKLEVRPSNKKAISFYTKRGFQKQGVIENFYTCGERCYSMVRYL